MKRLACTAILERDLVDNRRSLAPRSKLTRFVLSKSIVVEHLYLCYASTAKTNNIKTTGKDATLSDKQVTHNFLVGRGGGSIVAGQP